MDKLLESKSSLQYLSELNQELLRVINLHFNLPFGNLHRVTFIGYNYRFNRFNCEFFNLNFYGTDFYSIKFKEDKINFAFNQNGEILDDLQSSIASFFSQKHNINNFRIDLSEVYQNFCDNYIDFFVRNFKKEFYENFILKLNEYNDKSFSLNDSPKFFIRKKVNERKVVKRYKRGEGKSYTHYFTFDFTFDIIDNAILDNPKFIKCMELLLNNNTEIVDDSDEDYETFTTIYDNVKVFSGQIDYSLTSQVNQYVVNGNLDDDIELSFSNVVYNDKQEVVINNRLKSLYFLLSIDVKRFVDEHCLTLFRKLELVEYLFFNYNYYIDRRNKLDFRGGYNAFYYEFDNNFFCWLNENIVSVMPKYLKQSDLIFNTDLFIKCKIEHNYLKGINIYYLKFLKHTIFSKS